MPVRSVYRDIEIPLIDLWTYHLEWPLAYPRDHPIFIDPETKRSYSLNDVKRLAAEFGKGLVHVFNLKKGDRVGLSTLNHIDIPILKFAVHWFGGVLSPANPAYTPEELARQLKDSGAKILLTQKHMLASSLEAAALANLPASNIVLMGDGRDETGKFKHWTEITARGARVQPTKPAFDPKKDLAYLVYSSGTTGMPKGVMLTHFNMVANSFQLKPIDTTTLVWDRDAQIGLLPLFHIYGLGPGMATTLESGAPCVMLAKYDAETFFRIIQDYSITYLYVPPPIVLDIGKSPLADNYNLTSLRWINSGAAPLGRELVQAAWGRHQVCVKQAYGLSETSPLCIGQLSDEFWKYPGSIGRLAVNMTAMIVDDKGNELERMQEGELWLKGPNVFSGYWNRPDLQDNTFSADGWFKTGDIGYVCPKGNFYISDRIKELIKYKGFQVAPAELEAKIMGRDDVADVCVVGILDKEQCTELPLACVVLKPGVEASEAKAKEIVDWVSTQVASPKRLRGGVRFIKQVPKTASGKILRRILRDQMRKEAEEAGAAAKAKL